MEQRVTMVTLGVADVGRARAFYERLGWRASSMSQPEIAFFQVGSLGLALYPQTNVAHDTGLKAPPVAGGVTLACNVAGRDAVDRTMADVAAAGATVLKAPHETHWGGYVGYFADLDGHPWEVTYAPMIDLTADGALKLPA